MKLKPLFILLFVGVWFSACEEKPEMQAQAQAQAETKTTSDMKKANTLEVVQGGTYTYLRVEDNDREYWIATSKTAVDAGSSVYFKPGLEMVNFQSKELNKTFDVIYFVQQVSTTPEMPAGGGYPGMGENERTSSETDASIQVTPAAGGVTIAELYDNRQNYANKTVKVRGKVTKFNASIMDRNWVHIQDGTKSGNAHDLTITTNERVNKGDVVTFSGKIVLGKDFGAGYAYEVLMEEASQTE